MDIPANAGLETITPQNVINILLALKAGNLATLSAAETQFVAALGPKATKAFYPGDPANINHSYIGDFVKFRNTHNGFEQHVFHLHNHQWLFNPNDDNSNYLDAQGIGPGMGYTYEIANGGSGNRNKSAGDAIYHCHFYPHFAQGMWYMWRNHDVFEAGTKLAVSGNGFHTVAFALKDGTPAAGARALPDGELVVGTPIPAVVPLPGKGLAPMPAPGVTVKWWTAMVQPPAAPPARQSCPTRRSPARTASSARPTTPTPASRSGSPASPAGRTRPTPPASRASTDSVRSTPPMDMMTKAEAEVLVNSTKEPFASMAPR